MNTAVVLARLGLRPTMLAQVGDDEFGSRALAELAAAGVGTEWVARTPADITGMNVVVIDPDGERTMIGLRGANRSFGGTWAHQGEWLHVSAYALLEGDQRKAALAILEQARREGVPISMDVPSGVARALGPQLVPAFDGVTVLTVGRRSLDPIGRDAAALAARCEVVAVTDGDRSVEIRRAGDVFRLTPPSVPVEDTTGAGDSFIAGLVASHSWGLTAGGGARRRWELPPSRCPAQGGPWPDPRRQKSSPPRIGGRTPNRPGWKRRGATFLSRRHLRMHAASATPRSRRRGREHPYGVEAPMLRSD